MCETRYDAVQEVEVLVRDCQTCTCPTSPTDHNWQQINGGVGVHSWQPQLMTTRTG